MKEFGRAGVKVSEVGMGTYYDPIWISTAFFGWRRRKVRKIGAIRCGLEGGMNLIDTAEIYGSEPLIREALSQVNREEVFLATKVWSNHLHGDDLVRSLGRSLSRLGTTYVDLYQVHWPNPHVPIRETMGAMQSLVNDGRVKHVGVSNFGLSQLREANSALPKSEISAVQLDYSLVTRNVERDILPYCQENGIVLLAYYPLGHGRLASSPELNGIAKKYGKTRAQIALRWLARKNNVFPIPRASTVAHVQEDLGASGWELAAEDVKDLETKFR
jgi:diketogulonate reductase-like aldo/keto reductase